MAAAVAVFPATPKPPAPERLTVDWGLVVGMYRRAFVWGVSLAVPLSLAVWGFAAGFSAGASDLRADGVDLRSTGGELRDSRVAFALVMVMNVFRPLVDITYPTLFHFAATGSARTGRPLLAVQTVGFAVHTGAYLLPLGLVRLVQVSALVLMTVGLAVCLEREHPGLGRPFVSAGVGMGLVSQLHMAFVFPGLWDAETSDVTRAVYVALLPLMVDAPMYFARQIARRAGGRSEHRALLLVSTTTLQHMLTRVAVASTASNGGLALVAVVASLSEAVARATVRRRDAWLTGQGAALQPLPEFVFVEQMCEICATVVVAAMVLAFRVSDSRSAPAAAGVLLSAAAQLATEVLGDAAPLLLLRLKLRVAVRRGARAATRLQDRARAVARWQPSRAVPLLVLFESLGMVLWIVVWFTQPDRRNVLCPWSEYEGRWHWVSCATASAWVSG